LANKLSFLLGMG